MSPEKTPDRWRSPEERELEAKQAEFAELEARLADRELDLATDRGTLQDFEVRYLRTVGARLAELDGLEADIAECLERQIPHDIGARARTAEARARARESRSGVDAIAPMAEQERFKPSQDLRKLYREVARLLHPDLTLDEAERIRRTQWMAEANRAYQLGDQAALERILREWRESPDSVIGHGTGPELIRAIRKIAQVKARLETIEVETAQLRQSELWQLMQKVEEANAVYRDLLAEMAGNVERRVESSRQRLAELTHTGPLR